MYYKNNLLKEKSVMFKVIRIKTLLMVIGILMVSVLLSVGIVQAVGKADSPKKIYTIVIDSGHGGRDKGCSGKNGSVESDINLEISRTLKEYLETLGISVVMTRSDGNGLYEANADNYKQSDMEKRIEIINKANPDMVISIHQNSYNDNSQKGSQVFYQEEDVVAAGLADRCEIQISYAIGVAQPVSLLVDTFGTGKRPADRIRELILKTVDLRPSAIIDRLSLRTPFYRHTASYGHFGSNTAELPWEQTNLPQLWQDII